MSLSLATATTLTMGIQPALAAGCPTVSSPSGMVTPAPAPGVQWSGCDLTGADLAGTNMSDGNLSSATLTSANLTGATLTGLDLNSADLTDANLTNAKLMQANLSSATMTGATLTGVSSGLVVAGPAPTLPTNWSIISGYLIGPGAGLQFANLTSADLTDADLADANLASAELSHVTLAGTILVGSTLTGVSSADITGTPASLPANWITAGGYLVGPGANLSNAALGNLDLSGQVLTSANLNSADLSGSDLSDADLADAILTGVKLTGTNLGGANLAGEQSGEITGTPASLPTGWSVVSGDLIGPGADLHDADLATFTLNGADLYQADLSGADLVQASLTGADLGRANLTSASLGNANLTDARLPRANLTSATLDLDNLTGTVLTSANLTDASISDATVTGAKLSGATLTGASGVGITGQPASLPANWSIRGGYLIGPGAGTLLTNAHLGHLNLAGADFSGLDLFGTSFTHSNLISANLTKANLAGADFTDSNLAKADLDGATVSSTVFAGTIWSDTICPDGSNSGSHSHGECFPPPVSSGFTSHQLPVPSGGSGPNGLQPQAVSCASATHCFGGGLFTGSQVGRAPAWFYWTGGRWFSAAAPTPSGASSGPQTIAAMTSISCPSLTTCLAGGNFNGKTGNQAMLLKWNGVQWTATQAPLPAGAGPNPDATVTGISCPSTATCAAVGYYSDADTNLDGLLLRWSAGKWSAAKAPIATGAVETVSCPTANACFAGGWQNHGSLQQEPLILRRSAGKWTTVNVSLPKGAATNPQADITGISCPLASQCVASGNYTDSRGDQRGLLLILSGGTWTAVKAPLPATAGSNPGTTLNAVSCAAAHDCVVAGGYENTAGQDVGVLLFWSGKTWKAIQAPTGTSTLHAISCPTSSRCVAVGEGASHPVALIGP
jgi:uncharacterized protein YjbI with pentapeptide repeats